MLLRCRKFLRLLFRVRCGVKIYVCAWFIDGIMNVCCDFIKLFSVFLASSRLLSQNFFDVLLIHFWYNFFFNFTDTSKTDSSSRWSMIRDAGKRKYHLFCCACQCSFVRQLWKSNTIRKDLYNKFNCRPIVASHLSVRLKAGAASGKGDGMMAVMVADLNFNCCQNTRKTSSELKSL